MAWTNVVCVLNPTLTLTRNLTLTLTLTVGLYSTSEPLPTAWSVDGCRNVSLEEGDRLAVSMEGHQMTVAVANQAIPAGLDDFYFEAASQGMGLG